MNLKNSTGKVGRSKVQLCGINKHECNYCKTDQLDTSVSFGFLSSHMLIADYEKLMLRGWRRSGTYFYKPLNHEACCPAYTIRLNICSFQISKSQKKLLKKVNQQLKAIMNPPSDPPATTTTKVVSDNKARTKANDPIRQQKLMEKQERLRLKAAGRTNAPKEGTETVESEGKEVSDQATSTVEPASSSTNASQVQPVPRYEHESLITSTLEPASFSEEKYQLYKKYQTLVHHDKEDELTPEGFTRFLVESPLVDPEGPEESKPHVYGTYHQLYRLNGKLIAVGVLDLVPSGVSSVYCFYDEGLSADLFLGKYTALQEISFAAKHNYSYYYMGFYIHNCVKMRYKGEYSPSELLCNKTLDFVPIEECLSALDKYLYSPFSQPYRDQRAELTKEQDKPKYLRDHFVSKNEKSYLSPKSSTRIKPEDLKLDLVRFGCDGLMRLSDLSQSFVKQVKPMMQDFLDYAGEDMALTCLLSI